ncbi:NAD(P)-dependent oxidoreductase [Nocardioides gansuensis]|uniref:NAD(P)-dependent oxidoreductase n=1 Tax=Nocardioides gansuensis TaxID=2138300 RepID=A0A2T8FE63_9ACTN|nr:NAD(P)-dependent oxidoreductase [Nocardioides gansuensis]PVG83997.1 NAD(P)-dependent oxidoreductase [Nocardioides gansuensis]
MTLRVAVVGTGRMGSAMVGRVTGGGFPVVVHNRSRDKAEVVAERHGCEVADTARDAVAGADVVLVSLPDDAAAHAAYGGDAGIVAGLARGAVVTDTSTIAPATVRRLATDVAHAGATLLDTPVSGSVSTVEAGQLTVMAGGDPSALDRARPVLETMASSIVHCGPQGSGAALKLAVNTIVHALDIALSEALVLAEKAGLDRETAYDVFAHSAVGAPFVHYKRAAFLSPGVTPVAFALDLVAKDLELAAALASEVGARTPQLERNREVVADAVSTGLGGADLSAVAEYLRR